MKNTDRFFKIALEDMGGNAGGVVGNVENDEVYRAYIGRIGN